MQSSGIWIEIELDRVGSEVRVSTRSSRGEQPRPHSLGPQLSIGLSGFTTAVYDAAARRRKLSSRLVADAQTLQRAVLHEETGKLFERLVEAVRAQLEKGVRKPLLVRLLLHDTDLKAVPWEAFAVSGESMGFWGSAADILPVRAVTTGDPWQTHTTRGAVRVLAIAPAGGPALAVLRAALDDRIAAGEVEWLDPVEGPAAAQKALFERLRRGPTPHVIHFIGHGGLHEGAAALKLPDEDGEDRWLPVELLGQQLRAGFRGFLRLVVLEVCEGAAPSAVASAAEILGRAGADAVVAHLWPVRADVARVCSEELYRALAGADRGQGNVAFALNEARRSILAGFDGSAEAFSPVLYLRGPDGVLFDFNQRELAPPSPNGPHPRPPRVAERDRPSRHPVGFEAPSAGPADRVIETAVNAAERDYRDALRLQLLRVDVPGTRLSIAADGGYVWPSLRMGTVMEEENEAGHPRMIAGERVNLTQYPHAKGSRTVIVAGAGFGKSELLRAIARTCVETEWLPVIVALPRLKEKDRALAAMIPALINEDFSTCIRWEHEFENGRAVLLFDGLDELSDKERSVVVRHLDIFSARYPTCSWIVATRDDTLLAPNVAVPRLVVEMLDDERREQLVRALTRNTTADAGRLLGHSARNRELDRLSRIPLFLALIVSHYLRSPNLDLPARRSDLLDDYIETLIRRPHQGKSPLYYGPTALRSAAERLAFEILERQEAETSEREIAHALLTNGVDPDKAFEDIRSCGLTLGATGRVRFALPIVQEYLAGCFMAWELADQIVTRFASQLTRPWAQALQFAVERSRNAESILRTILAQPDDAFQTRLKTVARAIANGASVSGELRREIGDRLAETWLRTGFTGHRALTLLIADGFATPLPDAVRAAIERGERFNEGAELLISAAGDDTLTRQVVKARQNRIAYTANDLLPAFNRVADDVLTVYLDRLRNPLWKDDAREREQGAIASSIAELSSVSLDRARLERLRADKTLPNIVRLALYVIGQMPLPTEAQPLLETELRTSEGHALPTWRDRMVLDALWRLEGGGRLWRHVLMDQRQPINWRRLILSSVFRLGPDTARTLLSELNAVELGPALERHRMLLLGFLGDERSLCSLSDKLQQFDRHEFRNWLAIASRYGTLIEAALPVLRNARDDVRVEHGNTVAFICSYEVRFWGEPAAGLGGAYARLHASADRFSELFAMWSRTTKQTPIQLGYLACAGALGDHESWRALLMRLGEMPCGSRPNDLTVNHGASLVHTGLQFRAQNFGPLSFDLLKRFASLKLPNIYSTAQNLIARYASREALEFLLDEYNAVTTKHAREHLIANVETVALRLGARIVRNGERLWIEDSCG